jgi:GNAT superfamily N-acetyltransferase
MSLDPAAARHPDPAAAAPDPAARAGPPPASGYTLTEDPARFDLDSIHAYLTGSYWAAGVSRETVERSVRGSVACVGLLDASGGLVGFCRAVGDGATFAYVADVYVLREHRGRGLATWMLRSLMAHPAVAGVRRAMLATRDAHPLYARLGFVPVAQPERWMELTGPARGQSSGRPADS